MPANTALDDLGTVVPAGRVGRRVLCRPEEGRYPESEISGTAPTTSREGEDDEPMKFVHTADWQLGMKAAWAGARAEKLRQARFAAAEKVVELANERRADFLVLAGDTFEDNGVDPLLVRRVVDLLARAHCPVFVLPGNHDPLGPGSVYRHPAWSEAEPKVSVFRTPEPVEAAGGVLLPCPVTDRTSLQDPTARIPPRGDDRRIRVGIAHGSLCDHGFEVKPDDFPIASNAPLRAGLDYLALGHWHSTLVEPNPREARVAYAGTPEPTDFGETGSGHALFVTIGGPGSPARVEIVETAQLVWISRNVTVAADEDVAALRRSIEAVPEPARTLLRVRVDGVASPESMEALATIEELAAARFLAARVERDKVLPRPEDGSAWSALVPDGVAPAVVDRLLRITASDPDPTRRKTAAHDLRQGPAQIVEPRRAPPLRPVRARRPRRATGHPVPAEGLAGEADADGRRPRAAHPVDQAALAHPGRHH